MPAGRPWRVTLLMTRQNVNCKTFLEPDEIRKLIWGQAAEWLELPCWTDEGEEMIVRVKRAQIDGALIAPWINKPQRQEGPLPPPRVQLT